MNIRLIRSDDYHKGFYRLLGQLTQAPEMSYQDFLSRLRLMTVHGIQTYVIEKDDRIVGTASLMIEPKFIRSHGFTGHIEDVVVDSGCRGQGLGRILIERLTTEANGVSTSAVMNSCLYWICSLDWNRR